MFYLLTYLLTLFYLLWPRWPWMA